MNKIKQAIILLYGLGCIQKDAKIDYIIYDSNGKKQNAKGGTIEHLFNRFHNIPVKGKGYYQRETTLNSTFSIRSFLPNGIITTSKIENVIYSGIKEVFEVTTTNGDTLQTTKDHKFFRPDGNYTELERLKVGDYITTRGRYKTKKRENRNTPEYLVKYHRTANRKVVNGYVYYRIPEHRFIYEANVNGFTVEEYRSVLNTETKIIIDALYSIPIGSEVHHIDIDYTNNDICNLQVLTKEAHRKLHDDLNPTGHSNWRMIPTQITNIKSIGNDHVYDITCQEDTPNFLANGIGVHNCSGKSFSLATLFKLQTIRPNQRVIILTTEKNSIDGLQRGLKHHKIDLKAGQLFYTVIRPKNKKAFKTELAALKKFASETVTQTMQTSKDSNANKDKYTYFIDVVGGLETFKGTDYVTGEEVSLGNIADLGQEDILVIDGLSPIIHGIWSLLQGDRKVNQMGDYQVVQKQINDFTYELVNSIECSLIMLAHADRLMDDIEKTEKIRVALDAGVALSGKYIGKFADVIYANVTNAGKHVWTGKKLNVETAARNFPSADSLEPDFSLYNFFKEDGLN